MDIVQARVDERLIHGQMLNAWCAELKPSCLLILDSELQKNAFMANVFRALAPMWLETVIIDVEAGARYIEDKAEQEGRLFLLSRTPIEYAKLVKKGIPLEKVTLAGRMYRSGRTLLSKECRNAIATLRGSGTIVLAQDLPGDEPVAVSI